MSFTEIITVTSSLIAIISAVAAFLGYMSKHIKDKQAIMIVMITSLVITLFLTGSIALAIGLSQPTIAINHYTSPPLPGKPAQTEPSNNTVVVPTSQTDVTKTIIENRTLTCVTCSNGSGTGLKVVLDSIVISTSKSNMTWKFTITNSGTSGCAYMHVPVYIEDQAGVRTEGGQPGTLTVQNPIGAGQSLQEYTTIALVPKAGVPYTMHASQYCYNDSDTDQSEIFTF
jgi:hypothetical protein